MGLLENGGYFPAAVQTLRMLPSLGEILFSARAVGFAHPLR